jgi:hypothetical protein
MNQFNKLFSLFFIVVFGSTFAQKKTLQAKTAVEKISIDGILNEAIWNNAPIATDFVMFQPDNGKAISSDKKTDVRILYDNEAIYIAAKMFDNEPKKILKEITQRDNIGTADVFGVFLNGFNDGQQDFQFFVSASGVQIDKLATEDGEVTPDNYSQDFSWDAIWDSEVQITDFGWTVEMRVPYAALRFPKDKVQTWGINFFRNIRRDRQSYTWSPIDSNVRTTRNQNGVLEGLENLKTPTRLFFIPYTSYYYEKNQAGSENKFKAGLDIKYGINDSFTLDAILVPDFGQTKFDNVILNLSPFEQQFVENRPFFTEGTNLFSKGNLFYSRRIGGRTRFSPLDYDAANETIIDKPATVNLLNAIKISGRTKSGLGIGVLNAVTEKTLGTIQNDVTKATRKGIVEPLTNYNILVLDQRFGQNSSVSLINTNVIRNGSYRDSNTSGFLFDLYNKKNTYSLFGDFKYAYIETSEIGNFSRPYVDKTGNYDGYKTSLYLEKISGKNRFLFAGKYFTKNYDINDFGYATQRNYHAVNADYNYRIINPKGIFNTWRFDLSNVAEIENTTGKLQLFYNSFSTEFTTKANDYYKAYLQVNALETFDFYQPQTTGSYSYVPRSFESILIFSSNYNRAFALDVQPQFRIYDERARKDFGILVSPRYRLNDRISLIFSSNYFETNNDKGLVYKDGAEIYFSKRKIAILTNEFSGKLALNNKMTINLLARHYWSYSENYNFYTLNKDGYLTDTAFIPDTNQNFNAWNFDLSYSWWFAPASQISILYRNNSEDYTNLINKKVGQNFKNLFDSSLNNILSFSIRYYIDYNSLKRK